MQKSEPPCKGTCTLPICSESDAFCIFFLPLTCFTMPSEPAALVLPSSLFLFSFFFPFCLLFSLLSCYFTSWVHTFPGKYPEYPSPTYHVPAPLFCVGRSSIFEARAICLNAEKNPQVSCSFLQGQWPHFFCITLKGKMQPIL